MVKDKFRNSSSFQKHDILQQNLNLFISSLSSLLRVSRYSINLNIWEYINLYIAFINNITINFRRLIYQL